ncbi:MAG: LEPR-XLL domain-containing protein, partial [Burkholderiaceae bacterium]
MSIRRRTARSSRKNRFVLETLEPRVLLSADPLTGSIAALIAPAVPGAAAPDSDPSRNNASGLELSRPTANETQPDASIARLTLDASALQQLSDHAGVAASDGVQMLKLSAIDPPRDDRWLAIDSLEADPALGITQPVAIHPGWQLGGSGYFEGSVVSSGVVSPGHSPGVLRFGGDFTTLSTTLIELGGTRPASGNSSTEPAHDWIDVSGRATLGGELQLSLWDNFRPKAGDEFVILRYGSVQGRFDSGRGLFGLHDDIWFDLVQTGDAQTPGELKLVAREVVGGEAVGLIAGAITGTDLDQIGAALNADYFRRDFRVAIDAAFGVPGFDLSGAFELVASPSSQSVSLSATGLESSVAGQRFSGNFSITHTIGPVAATTLTVANGRLALGVDAARIEVSGISGSVQLDAKGFTGSLSATRAGLFDESDQPIAGLAIDSLDGLEFLSGAMSIRGLSLNAEGLVSAQSDFGVAASLDGVTLVAENLSARLGDASFALGLDQGEAALVLDAEGGWALQAQGVLHAQLGPAFGLSAASARLALNSSGRPWGASDEVEAAGLRYQFFEMAADASLLVSLQEAVLDVAGFVELSGDLTVATSIQDLDLVGAGPVLGARVFDLNAQGVAAFAGVGTGDERIGLQLADVDLALRLAAEPAQTGLSLSTPKTWLALRAQAAEAAVVGTDQIVAVARDLTLELNRASAPNAGVLDLSGAPVAGLDFSTAVEAIHIGWASFRIADSIFVQGAFSFSRIELDSVSAAGTPLPFDVEGFTVGADDVDLFMGYASESFDPARPFSEQADALYGFGAEDVRVGFLSARNLLGGKHTAVSASSGAVRLYGIDPADFQVSASGVNFALNTSSGLARPIDFKRSFPVDAGQGRTQAGYSIATGGAPVLIDFAGDTRTIGMRGATLGIAGFAHLSGSFGVDFGGRRTLPARSPLGNPVSVKADSFTIGATGVSAFVGVGGPYRTDTNGDGAVTASDAIANPDAMGLLIDDLSFALGLFRDSANRDRFVALTASAGQAGFIGFGEQLDLSVSDLDVAINYSSNPARTADFSALEGGGLRINNGQNDVLIDFDSALTRVSAGHVTADLMGLFHFEGGLSFERKIIDAVSLRGLGMAVDLPAEALIVAGRDLQAFTGINGPYLTDSNRDGSFDDEVPSADAIGFALNDVDLAFAMLQPALGGGQVLPISFYGIKASA